jgi:hypothetical protein
VPISSNQQQKSQPYQSRNSNKNIDLASYSTSSMKNMNDLKSVENASWTAYMPKKMINLVKSFQDD